MRHGVLCTTIGDATIPWVLPDDWTLITSILRELQVTPMGGHLGFRKLYALAKLRFMWKTMRDDATIPLVPPDDWTMITSILRELYVTPMGGHLGFRKLYALAISRFMWKLCVMMLLYHWYHLMIGL